MFRDNVSFIGVLSWSGRKTVRVDVGGHKKCRTGAISESKVPVQTHICD